MAQRIVVIGGGAAGIGAAGATKATDPAADVRVYPLATCASIRR